MIHPLDLYAKIEPLIGFYEQYEKLYALYLTHLKSLHVNHVLDVGCGNGKFLKHLQNNAIDAFGIDRSSAMIERALSLGVNASTQELDTLEAKRFDCVVAVADVLNYIPPYDLTQFFEAVARVLSPKGYFICDVNTLYGFESVADGVMNKETDEQFLCVEAAYKNKELLTKITLFEKEGEVYRKETGEILQFFHSLSVLKKLDTLRLHSSYPIFLFGDEADKMLLIFQKR